MLFKHVAGALVLVASTFMAAGCTALPPAELVPESSRATIYLKFPATQLAVGADAIWVVGGGHGKVFRIDPKRYIVSQSFSIHGNGVAVGGDAVWVASSPVLTVLTTLNPPPGVVYRIDPQTNQIVATVEVGRGVGGIAVGEDAVWVSNDRDDTISRIDTFTNRVVATIAVGDHPDGIAVGEGAVWVANRYGTVSRIDPRTNAVVATVTVGSWTHGVAVGAGRIWVVRAARWGLLKGTVLQIDPKTNRLIGDPIPVEQYPSSVVVGHGFVWVSSFSENSISRIDPVTNQVNATLRVPCPWGLAISKTNLWVAHHSGSVRRCGNAITSLTP